MSVWDVLSDANCMTCIVSDYKRNPFAYKSNVNARDYVIKREKGSFASLSFYPITRQYQSHYVCGQGSQRIVGGTLVR